MKYYLAYGSNLNVQQMKDRCPSAKKVGHSFIHGYRLAFFLHATILKDKNSKVPVGI